MCGGTENRKNLGVDGVGLSPRVRGNRWRAAAILTRCRSIPACAGEPTAGGLRRSARGVYPRVCGGTGAGGQSCPRIGGLSPRVRGNRVRAGAVGKAGGSIPACAGEPAGALGIYGPGEVYPRVCGGTRSIRRRPPIARGLSPRVRGNPSSSGAARRGAGSIPACAGEPHHAGVGRYARAVYPRVCGGTGSVADSHHNPAGLSPRVRGNRIDKRHQVHRAGSIPACAGEPGLSMSMLDG